MLCATHGAAQEIHMDLGGRGSVGPQAAAQEGADRRKAQ